MATPAKQIAWKLNKLQDRVSVDNMSSLINSGMLKGMKLPEAGSVDQPELKQLLLEYLLSMKRQGFQVKETGAVS